MLVTNEAKESKIAELQNLIGQYEAGERQNIDADKYDIWVKCISMLRIADIDQSIYEDFLIVPKHYYIDKNRIKLNPAWEEEEAEAEAKRIANLHITKLDFYTLFCKPVGISYATLVGKIAELNMEAEWNLCNHVYYGIIKPFLNALPLGKTEAEIIAIFEEYTKED